MRSLAPGGKIIAAGTPEDVAATKESYTGQYLRDLLGRRAKGRAAGAQEKSAEGAQGKNGKKKQAAE
ncbi:MAG: hypothetical protein Q8K85_09900 [Hyphomicrobium sp.]|nr:hypothetical protein [Hyphomicrobium sp.]